MEAGHCQLLRSEPAKSGFSNSPHLTGQLQQNSTSGHDLGYYYTGAQFVRMACSRLVWLSEPVTTRQSRLLFNKGEGALYGRSSAILSHYF